MDDASGSVSMVAGRPRIAARRLPTADDRQHRRMLWPPEVRDGGKGVFKRPHGCVTRAGATSLRSGASAGAVSGSWSRARQWCTARPNLSRLRKRLRRSIQPSS